MKLSDYITRFLAKHTRHAFVGTGGCIVHVLDSLNKSPHIHLVPCENEQGAAIAAEAYYRVKGKIGVAIATSGPGMINLIQGIACAYFDSTPSLYISGAPPTYHLKGKHKVRQMGFQEMDVIKIVKPLTKYAVLLTNPKRIRYELEKLIYSAFEGRPGPVLLDLPDDIQRAHINPQKLKSFIPKRKTPTLNKTAINKTMGLIKKAARPVIIVGGGVKTRDVRKELKTFLNKSRIPFATTWATIDMFLDNEPNLIGNFGISANRAGNFAIQNCDLLISLGSRLDTHGAGSDVARFAPKAKKIVVDIDRAELDKHTRMKTDLKIHCDLKTFLKGLINSSEIETRDLNQWKRKIQEWKDRYPIYLEKYYKQKNKVNPYVFMNELSKETKEGDIVVTETGATLTWTMQAYKIRTRQALFSAFNHASMGYALPAAIGAQYAAPENRVICITGDGGIQMNIQELETIAYNKLPIKIFLINNRGYGMIKQTQDTWLDSVYVASDPSCGLGFPDFQKVAKAYKIKTLQIANHGELKKMIRKVLSYKGPVLCDVKLRPGEKIIPKLEFGRPLEDMSPLLPRSELKANRL
ncbi:MAG: thiamine pyrophosphate-binding protein [Candidatus Omnitrophota bacterium]|nr:MAG: thiamine pyrophosphate-binding protein [Candidatus Omnitrophota bacterium]